MEIIYIYRSNKRVTKMYFKSALSLPSNNIRFKISSFFIHVIDSLFYFSFLTFFHSQYNIIRMYHCAHFSLTIITTIDF